MIHTVLANDNNPGGNPARMDVWGQTVADIWPSHYAFGWLWNGCSVQVQHSSPFPPLYHSHTHTKLLFLRPTWLAELRLWRCVAALSRPLSWRLAVWDSGAALNANNQSGAFTHALDAVGFPSPTSALALPLLLSKHTGILTVQPFIPLFSHTAHRKKSC